MAQVRIEQLTPTPVVITPKTDICCFEEVPQGTELAVIRQSTKEQDYPSNGQKLFMHQEITLHMPINADAIDTQVWGQLRGVQHLDLETPFQQNVVIIAPQNQINAIQKDQYFTRFPVVPAELLDNILHGEELQKYGVENPIGNQMGGLLIKGLLLDRVIRSKIIGQQGDWDVLYSSYPKGKSGKQPVRLAEPLAIEPTAFFSHMVTTTDLEQVSIFPDESLKNSGIEGGVIYKAFTKDNIWPTHRIMGRREFFDSIPLSTGEHTQNLLTILSAIDFARAYNLPIARVFDELGLQDEDLEPVGEMAYDYNQVLGVLAEVLFKKQKRLIDVNEQDFVDINRKLRVLKNPRLGEILPSLSRLIKYKIVDLHETAIVERTLYSKIWPTIPGSLLKIVPENLMIVDSLDPDDLIRETTQMVQTDPSDQEDDKDGRGLKQGIKVVPDGERETHLMEMQRAQVDYLNKRAKLRQLYLFNPQRFHPDAYEIRHFFEQGKGLISDTDIVAIEPMHKESQTGRPIADYVRKFFPADRFITGSNDQETLSTFEGFDGIVVHQDRILSFIKRKLAQEQGIIPWNAVPQEGSIPRQIINTKGDTVKALFLSGLALGIIQPDTQVMLLDSDWENVEGLEKYAPVEYLSGTLANQPPDKTFIMTLLARIGKERRNQVVLNALNNWSNKNGFQRLVSDNMRKIIWFLSGERVIPAKMIIDHPFPNGYSMEIWLDLLTSIHDIQDSDQTIAQVSTPTKKILKDSLPSKDWAMTMFCANMFDNMMSFWQELLSERINQLPENDKIQLKSLDALSTWERLQTDLMPQNWDSKILSKFNYQYGGMPMVLTTPSDAELDPQNAVLAPNQDWRNIDYVFSQDFLEPSVAELDDLQLIDWEGLVGYLTENLGIQIDPQKLENAWWRQRQKQRSGL